VRAIGSKHQARNAKEYYAGVDVSLKESSACVVDVTGKVVRKVKVAGLLPRSAAWYRKSEPSFSDAIATVLWE
jgi:hypothetical protein